jgi:hypothetical protein
MTTSVSQRLNILCIMFKIISFFIIMLFSWLYSHAENTYITTSFLWEGIFGPHHFSERGYLGHIISLRGEIWVHKTSLTQWLFMNVSVPSQESERSYICVLGYRFWPLSSIFLFYFGTVLTVWYFLFFI